MSIILQFPMEGMPKRSLEAELGKFTRRRSTTEIWQELAQMRMLGLADAAARDVLIAELQNLPISLHTEGL